MWLFSSVLSHARTCSIAALSLALAGCATMSVTPGAIRPRLDLQAQRRRLQS
jgi:hypothetical protein